MILSGSSFTTGAVAPPKKNKNKTVNVAVFGAKTTPASSISKEYIAIRQPVFILPFRN